MSSDRVAVETPRAVPSARLQNITASAFSTDNTEAAIQFEDEDDNPFVVHMPIDRLHALATICTDMLNRFDRREMSASQVSIKYPREFSIGYSDAQQGVVFVTFDEKQVSEAIYCLPNLVGLELSKQMEHNILSRMTAGERAEWARKKHPLLNPISPKIILPGH